MYRVIIKKKAEILILTCSVIFAIGLGTMTGCSTEVENNVPTEETFVQQENIEGKLEQVADSADAETGVSENMTIMSFLKEGREEQKQAELVTGYGYSVCMPVDEWQPSGPDLWIAKADKKASFWVAHFEKDSITQIEEKLAEEGYELTEKPGRWRREGELIYNVELRQFENDVWGVYYCYPAGAEEGWGMELPAIADTFALSDGLQEHGNQFLRTSQIQEGSSRQPNMIFERL